MASTYIPEVYFGLDLFYFFYLGLLSHTYCSQRLLLVQCLANHVMLGIKSTPLTWKSCALTLDPSPAPIFEFYLSEDK